MSDKPNIAVGIVVSFSGLDGELLDVNTSGHKVDVVDVTHQTAPGKWRIFRAALKDAGQATLTLLFDGSPLPAIGSGGDVNDPQPLVIAWPDGSGNETCNAILQEIAKKAPLGDRQVADLTFKFTGPWSAA